MVALDRELVNARSGWLGALAILISPPFGFLLGTVAQLFVLGSKAAIDGPWKFAVALSDRE